MERSDLTDEIAASLWCFFEDMAGPSDTPGIQGVHENSMTGDPFTADATLFNCGNDTAFTPILSSSMETAFTGQLNYSHPDHADAWAMPPQEFWDASPVIPNLLGNWPAGVSSNPAVSAAAAPQPVMSMSGSATPSGSQDEVLPWSFEQGKFTFDPTSSACWAGSEGNLSAPEFDTGITGISGITTYPVGWEVAQPIFGVQGTSAIALGKRRRRDEFHGDRAPVATNRGIPPRKRARDGRTNRILETARSATQTQPATTVPSEINTEPKQLVRGAERLVTPDQHGLHHRSLSGPRLRQGWVEEAADGQRVEGSVEEVARRTDSAVQGYVEIPQNLRVGYKALLMATPADWARGAVREIRCRLCPRATFAKWDDYKRHCNCSEVHPLSISFCEHCGDYFARSDSCQRHRQHRPEECLQATPEGAEAKRSATQERHNAFIARLEGYLVSHEEEVGMSFSKTMKDLYPGSSKKRISRE